MQSKHKELFKKTISNSSLNSRVFWDTLYYIQFLMVIHLPEEKEYKNAVYQAFNLIISSFD